MGVCNVQVKIKRMQKQDMFTVKTRNITAVEPSTASS